jgi:hypothetical protein
MRLLFSPLTLISDSVSCRYHFSVAADVSTLSPDPVARDAKPLEAPMPSTADHDAEPVEALDRWRPGSSRRLDPRPGRLWLPRMPPHWRCLHQPCFPRSPVANVI